MDDTTADGTPSGVPIPAAGLTAAEELARVARDAARGLPFEVEPASFLAQLERLAPADAEAS